MTTRTIVAATDFSPYAHRALRRAAALATEHKARLHIVHAIPDRDLLQRLLSSEATHTHAVNAAKDALAALAEEFHERDVKVTTAILRGGAARMIAAEVERVRPVALVVGAHGRSSAQDVVFGTTSERLVERVPCPVLVVRAGGARPYRRALVCADLGPASADALGAVAALCPEAELVATYVYEPLFEMKLLSAHADEATVRQHQAESRRHAGQALRTFLDGLGPVGARAKPLLRRGVPQNQILGAITQTHSDLIVVGRNRSLASDMFLGSISKHVLRRAKIDVLVVAKTTERA